MRYIYTFHFICSSVHVYVCKDNTLCKTHTHDGFSCLRWPCCFTIFLHICTYLYKFSDMCWQLFWEGRLRAYLYAFVHVSCQGFWLCLSAPNMSFAFKLFFRNYERYYTITGWETRPYCRYSYATNRYCDYRSWSMYHCVYHWW